MHEKPYFLIAFFVKEQVSVYIFFLFRLATPTNVKKPLSEGFRSCWFPKLAHDTAKLYLTDPKDYEKKNEDRIKPGNARRNILK